MSSLTKRGVPKARLVKELYRDPKYKGGVCCVCRKRQRNCRHPEYPHMCDHCLRTRVAIADVPYVAAREVMSEQMRRDQEMLERYLTSKQPKGVQSLNAPEETLQQRIAASAERFRNSLKK